MIICLKTSANHDSPQQATIHLTERLPFHMITDCQVNCNYLVRAYKDHYLLTLDVSGVLPILCQRCYDTFHYDYVNHTELAICRDEATAEKLLQDYESIVSEQGDLDLMHVITDELHLYAPEKHHELIDCKRKTEFSLENN